MAIKIYGRLSSANVQKINWLCNYANISVVNLNYGGIHGKTQTKAFKDMNPNSRVPVLDDNNFILYESNAILRYLSKKFDILVSTDSKVISKLTLKYNFNFLGLRPKSLSGDRIETKYVLKYEIRKLEAILKKKYKNILVLQPTCPFRDPKKIMLSLKKVKSNTYDSVVSVEEVKTDHPLRMKIFKSKYLTNFIKQRKEK